MDEETFYRAIARPNPKMITADDFCDCCGENQGFIMWSEGENKPASYCAPCRRAIRVAKMKEAGTLPQDV